MACRHIEGPAPLAGATEGTRWFDTDSLVWHRFDPGQGWTPIADLNASRVKWAEGELAVLRDRFEAEGVAGVAKRLPGRIPNGIRQRARKLGLADPNEIRGRFTNLNGEDLEEAIRLRDEHGWSFERIGKKFGVADTSASNAYFIASCPRRGFTPAKRDGNGRLLADEIERLRAMLRKGFKGCDIQLRLGVSAACVAEQRRRYERYLKANRKAPLPPHGGGERYSGARIDRKSKAEAERLFLTGLGAPKVSAATGISYTHCGRIRNKLVKRLARKGETLPGCDRKGRRTAQTGSARFVTEAHVAQIRALLLDGVGFKRASLIVGIGDCSAYKIRCAFAAELAARGEALPPTRRVGHGQLNGLRWLPPGSRWIYFFRMLAGETGEAEARRSITEGLEAIAALPGAVRRAIVEARRRRPPTLEEQLARIRAGAGIVTRSPTPSRAVADFPGGGSSLAL